MSSVTNAMTVDVEEHFQVSAFEGVIRRSEWGAQPSRVIGNTRRLLDLFDECEVQATFFVLGWIGEQRPRLVTEISARGHEIGCHGYSHRLVHEQERDEFERETRHARALLQDASGQEVAGYRAASFSIGRSNLWALDVLADCGFGYDSSLFPVVHDRYGIPGAPRGIHRVRTPSGGALVEVPPSTVSIGGIVLPVAGGGYLRIYPAAATHWSIRRLNRREGAPAIVYVHPWEVDPAQPRVRARLMSRIRHYTGLRTTAQKLRALARAFAFDTVASVIDASGVRDRSQAPVAHLSEGDTDAV